MDANNSPTVFSDEDFKNLKAMCGCMPEVWLSGNGLSIEVRSLFRRLEAAEKAVDECSCLTDHPAFTEGTRSYETLPRGMAARAERAKEFIEAWVKVTGKYL